jgi:hypothetical protein
MNSHMMREKSWPLLNLKRFMISWKSKNEYFSRLGNYKTPRLVDNCSVKCSNIVDEVS